jgi:recombination protein RecT
MSDIKNAVATQTPMDLAIDNKFINGLTQQIQQKITCGFTFPKDYNYSNALTGAYLTLLETKDKDGKPALEVCSKPSIAQAFMNLVTLGLDTQKKQAYFVPYGGKLQLQKSYFGNQAIARRYGVVDFAPQVLYEGDEFTYDVVDGKKCNFSHKQKFENIDINKIKGAYVILTFTDGSKYLELMTMPQIIQAWKQGFGYKEGGNGTHQKFTDQMCIKSVINRACKSVINTHGDEEAAGIYNEVEESEADDAVLMDVQYDVASNANTEEFIEPEHVQGEVVGEPKKAEPEKKETKQTKPTVKEPEIPEWMGQGQ